MKSSEEGLKLTRRILNEGKWDGNIDAKVVEMLKKILRLQSWLKESQKLAHNKKTGIGVK